MTVALRKPLIVMERIPERDWQKLKAMKDRVLDAACRRVLEQAQQTLNHREGRNHEAYLELYKLMNDGDQQIALMFNDLRRSTAIFKLVAWQTQGLLTDQDLEEFSEETRQTLALLGK